MKEKNEVEKKGVKCVEVPLQKVKEMTNVEALDDETIRMVMRMFVLRISTKHINIWMRQLEMKRREICELADLVMMKEVKTEVETERNLESWAEMLQLLHEESEESVV